ncbi:MAG TPA: hypothetical protein VL283_03055 [Candidatus Baltobacteraceae bacterium]|nr:hypothetical protein [Candidatus Baltobacteraceae bacterium]
MSPKKFFDWSVALSLGGTLFAGYLSAVKILTKTCAFGEQCPYFLGYPSCWYGFGMFLALLVLSLLGRTGKMGPRQAMQGILGVSILGTIFAGSFVVQEVSGWLAAGNVTFYGFGLPTCVYGLVFYLASLILAARFLTRRITS